MSEAATKKPRRSIEERVSEIDKKIAFHQAAVRKLEEKKQSILNPKPRNSDASKMKALLFKAKEAGMSVDEIAEKLGFELI